MFALCVKWFVATVVVIGGSVVGFGAAALVGCVFAPVFCLLLLLLFPRGPLAVAFELNSCSWALSKRGRASHTGVHVGETDSDDDDSVGGNRNGRCPRLNRTDWSASNDTAGYTAA